MLNSITIFIGLPEYKNYKPMYYRIETAISVLLFDRYLRKYTLLDNIFKFKCCYT